MGALDSLRVKIFADGADIEGIRKLNANPLIKGFTTNPTLMRAAGIDDYARFAREVLAIVPTHPVSFEVFADDFDMMEKQAREIASWGDNVNVKIPVTNTEGDSSVPVIEWLSAAGVSINVTAVFTLDQVQAVTNALHPETHAIISVFAGRIADTGVDPVPLMREAKSLMEIRPRAELLWASPREILNVFQADEAKCDIITVTHDMLRKLDGVGKDLTEFSRETVQMFFDDAAKAGYTIGVRAAAGTA